MSQTSTVHHIHYFLKYVSDEYGTSYSLFPEICLMMNMTDLSQDPLMKQNDLNKVNYRVNSDPILHHYIVGFYNNE